MYEGYTMEKTTNLEGLYVVENKNKPGIFLESKSPLTGDAPIAFKSVEACEEFLKKQTDSDDISDLGVKITPPPSEFFKEGDCVFLIEKEESNND